MQPCLTTSRLLLRPWRLEDAPRLSVLSRDPGFTEFTIAYRSPLDVASCCERIAERLSAAQYGLGDWAVVRGRRVIGALVLQRYLFEGDVEPEIEVGYRLEKAAWGRGLATEAAGRLVSYALDDLGVQRVVACIESVNSRSQAVARRLGMKLWRKTVFEGLEMEVFALTASGCRVGPAGPCGAERNGWM